MVSSDMTIQALDSQNLWALRLNVFKSESPWKYGSRFFSTMEQAKFSLKWYSSRSILETLN